MSSSLDRINKLMQHVSVARPAAASTLPPSTTTDVAWAPIVPVGHTAFSWGVPGASDGVQVGGAQEVQAQAVPAQAQPQEGKKQKKAKKQKQKKKKAAAPAKPAADAPVFTRLEFRVGRIVEAWKHPNADSMYVEKIDLGEDEPRQICSGLLKFVPLDEFVNSDVVVVTNLKVAKLRGEQSAGMVLAASNEDHTKVELVRPPAGAQIGERVFHAGQSEEERALPADAQVNPKKKKNNLWVEVAKGLKTDDSCVACYDGNALVTSAGSCTVESLSSCIIK